MCRIGCRLVISWCTPFVDKLLHATLLQQARGLEPMHAACTCPIRGKIWQQMLAAGGPH